MAVFSPEHLDALPYRLQKIYQDLELKLIREVCERIKQSGEINESSIYSIKALKSYGVDMGEIKQAIANALHTSLSAVDDLFLDVVYQNNYYYGKAATLAEITAPESFLDDDEIDAIKAQTKGAINNITASMGFLVNNGQTMLPVANTFQWVLDNAALQVQSGAISYSTAINHAIAELARNGLRTINYETGHRDQVDVAVRRAVLTGINQLNSQFAIQAMDILETDFVEVSAHSGARDQPGPLGFEAHTDWQGKVYFWARNGKTAASVPGASNYPDFETCCGYGHVQGILGANCRHNFSPFIPGVMERTYTDKELQTIDKPPFMYNGKEYTTYTATQEQRRIERTVRKYTRMAEAYKAAGETDQYNAELAKIKALRAEYEKFSKAAGLRTQADRMKVITPGVP